MTQPTEEELAQADLATEQWKDGKAEREQAAALRRQIESQLPMTNTGLNL
jgi:hypothetical protein